tara:strand:+ start:308 stop:451 length:144 start_codon:yes stop_codon:yes gene_type:complete
VQAYLLNLYLLLQHLLHHLLLYNQHKIHLLQVDLEKDLREEYFLFRL